MKRQVFLSGLIGFTAIMISCSDDDANPSLEIPTNYVSANYESNVVAENSVIDELSTMAAALNAAEASAQTEATVSAISYPSNLAGVTVSSYKTLIDEWLVELVKSANDDDGFQNPGLEGTPAMGEEGGLLGTRLLDENGLELEQMIEKGSFGAALYNHAANVIATEDLTDAATIDRLVEIHGTEPTFNPANATAAATYSVRRSNQTTQSGAFYDIRNSLLIAKAAIEAGSAFDVQRDDALAAYLLAWEESNFATVIFYCKATQDLLTGAPTEAGAARDEALGNAMHAYAEGVGFANGFRGIVNKKITDAQIDSILDLLEAPAGETPKSFEFLNNAALLENLDQIISDIQTIYGFTNEQVTSFYVNNPS